METRSRRRRRIYDALLTGVPFGIFKVAAGWWLWTHGQPLLGLPLMTWGAIDIGLNLVVTLFQPGLSYCLLAAIGRTLDRRAGPRIWEERLLALDTFLAFAIVSTMIWFRLLPTLPPPLGRAWDVAVIGNVMGVGVERLYRSVRHSTTPTETA